MRTLYIDRHTDPVAIARKRARHAADNRAAANSILCLMAWTTILFTVFYLISLQKFHFLKQQSFER